MRYFDTGVLLKLYLPESYRPPASPPHGHRLHRNDDSQLLRGKTVKQFAPGRTAGEYADMVGQRVLRL
jgi:hypothetical protein